MLVPVSIDMVEKENASSALQQGYYKVSGTWFKILVVEGKSSLVKGSVLGDCPVGLKYGDFGEADAMVREATGQSILNMELSVSVNDDHHKELGVITENGAKLTTQSSMGLHEYNKISKEEAELVMDEGDPIDAPPTQYKIQPENQGCLLWFSGPPGLGKSTSAQLLARENGYVYYEADCFNSCKNPYIPVDVPDPTMAQLKQRPLKGEGLEHRMEVIGKVMREFGLFLKGEEYEKAFFDNYYTLMCEDIRGEKERIGGDWAIAHCTMTRDMRDFIRTKLGPDFIFVLLEMDLDTTKERLRKRHHGDEQAVEMLAALNEKCDPAGDGEENVVTVKVTKEMSPQDVIKKTMEIVEKMKRL